MTRSGLLCADVPIKKPNRSLCTVTARWLHIKKMFQFVNEICQHNACSIDQLNMRFGANYNSNLIGFSLQ